MNKILVGVVAVLTIAAPGAVRAQSVSVPIAPECSIAVGQMTQAEELTCLTSLVQALLTLQSELSALQSATAPVAPAPAAPAGTGSAVTTTSAPVATGTSAVTPSAPIETVMTTKTISVTFNATGTEGYVMITNDTRVAIRVKNLNVPNGNVAGVTIGKKYGEGFVYQESFTDADGKAFNMFACDGLRSLGAATVPGNNNLDPCKRKDAQLAKNELRPGETMVLRYTKTGDAAVSAPVYQTGSIVEVETGSDVTF